MATMSFKTVQKGSRSTGTGFNLVVGCIRDIGPHRKRNDCAVVTYRLSGRHSKMAKQSKLTDGLGTMTVLGDWKKHRSRWIAIQQAL